MKRVFWFSASLIFIWFVGICSTIGDNLVYKHIAEVGDSIPTAFWINLDRNEDRARHMKQLLETSGIKSHARVSAIAPDSPEYRIKALEKPCKRNTDHHLAVIMSHLKAWYHAVYHDPQKDSPYALILEDDIRFLFPINFTALFRVSAPKDFGILQLSTSNQEAAAMVWKQWQTSPKSSFWFPANWKMSSKGSKTYLFWSAQGYIIQKSVIRRALDYVVHSGNSSSSFLSFLLVNSFHTHQCFFTAERPCVLSNCMFADTYLYSLGKPTYVSSLPLVTGSDVGLNSTLHQSEVSIHLRGFRQIEDIVQEYGEKQRACSQVSTEHCQRLRIPFLPPAR